MLDTRTLLRTRLLIGLTAALCAAAAFAADPAPAKGKPAATSATGSAKPAPKATEAAPREGAFGKGTSTQPLLTREQLRQCLAEQDRIKKEGAELMQVQARIEGDRVAIERMGTELEADKARLDATDEAAVNAYNERVRQRAKMIEEFKTGAPAFNQRVDKLVVDRQTYASGCADRRFFEEDFDAIKAGK